MNRNELKWNLPEPFIHKFTHGWLKCSILIKCKLHLIKMNEITMKMNEITLCNFIFKMQNEINFIQLSVVLIE